jgi:hypothetical protein
VSKEIIEFKVRPLTFDVKLVKAVVAQRKKGESVATIAKALKFGQGKVAMAELVGTVEHIVVSDPTELAMAIVKDRRDGGSWGVLAARYRVTEGTARAAYEAAAKEPAGALDFRRKSKVA